MGTKTQTHNWTIYREWESLEHRVLKTLKVSGPLTFTCSPCHVWAHIYIRICLPKCSNNKKGNFLPHQLLISSIPSGGTTHEPLIPVHDETLMGPVLCRIHARNHSCWQLRAMTMSCNACVCACLCMNMCVHVYEYVCWSVYENVGVRI